MSNQEKKFQVIRKVNELAQVLSINGMKGEDYQSSFLGETIQLVLMAGVDESHASLLLKHMSNFLREVQILTERKTTTEYLAGEIIDSSN